MTSDWQGQCGPRAATHPCGAVPSHGKRLVLKATGSKTRQLVAVVGPDDGTGNDAFLGKFLDGRGGLVGNLSEPDAPGLCAVEDLARLRVTRLLPVDLDGDNHRHLVGSAGILRQEARSAQSRG